MEYRLIYGWGWMININKEAIRKLFHLLLHSLTFYLNELSWATTVFQRAKGNVLEPSLLPVQTVLCLVMFSGQASFASLLMF